MPYTPLVVRDVALLCFPPEDVLFASLVRQTFDSVSGDTPAALQRALRPIFPRAVVRPQEALASFVGVAWYVYRDGRFSPFGRGPHWWEDPATARVVVDDDGHYVEANGAALRLLGVDLPGLRARVPGDFTVPDYGAAVPWILQLLRDTGELHSTSIVRPGDGGPDRPVEFRLVKDGDGPGRHVSFIRPVPMEAAELSAPRPPTPEPR